MIDDADRSTAPRSRCGRIGRWMGDTAARFRESLRRNPVAARIIDGIPHLLWILTAVYFILLFDFCVLLHWWAETNMVLAFLSFLPAIIWILPAAVLVPVSLFYSRRLASLQCLGVLAYFWLYMDYQMTPFPAKAPSDNTLTVLSYNRGQHRNHSLEPFKNEIRPDIIVLQESYGRVRLYRADPRYKEYPYVHGLAEFVILSKFPIGKLSPVTLPAWGKQNHISVRAEIDFNGSPIALYAVHMPTLRDVLGYYRRGALLYGIFGLPLTPWNEERLEQQHYWKERTRLARTLAETAAADKLPTLVLGDFNMPDHGSIYHGFAGRFTDAHEKMGKGFGYTFPGTSESFLTGSRPWLRLDYIFSGSDWETIRFTTETESRSQHRAIAATLELKTRPAD